MGKDKEADLSLVTHNWSRIGFSKKGKGKRKEAIHV